MNLVLENSLDKGENKYMRGSNFYIVVSTDVPQGL